MPDRDPRGDALLRGFARKVARLQRDLRILQVTAQGAHRSVEEGSHDFYDEDGVLRERVGLQKDGSYGRLTLDGPVPPVPSEPDVVALGEGLIAVTWDGRCEEKWPFAEFRNVRVHLGDTDDFTPTRRNQEGAIFAHRGGTILCLTESDSDNPVYVRLVAVSTAGHTSTPSDAVLVDEDDEEDYEDEVEELQWEDGDGHTLTTEDIAAGTVTFGLSHDPEVESLLAWWHPGGLAFAGVPQTRGTSFTVDNEAATVTWTLTAGVEKAGDRLRVYYAYMDDGSALLYGSSGWRYLTVDGTDAVDRSATAYDDTAWNTGPAPFSNGLSTSWPTVGTNWPKQGRIWLRRDVALRAGVDHTLSVRVDNFAVVWWNGVQILSVGVDSLTGEYDVVIPGADVLDVNSLAVRATDDLIATSPADGCYIDVQVVRS